MRFFTSKRAFTHTIRGSSAEMHLLRGRGRSSTGAVWLPACVALVYLAFAGGPVHAQDMGRIENQPENLLISYEDNLLSITARNVDIKQVFAIMAEKTGIVFSYPASLVQNINIDKSEVSLRAGLKSLLKDFNHAIVYSSIDKNAVVSKVFVYSSMQPREVNEAQDRSLSRIQAYESQIESLQNRLSTMDADSALGMQHTRRLRLLERNLEMLESQR